MDESNEHLRDIFRAAGRRLTSQRQLILEVLKESSEHLDADTLREQVKARAPVISLATVYRTLAVFKELGLVEEHRLGEGHCHYEAVRSDPHYHFTCRGCDKVIEFDTHLVAQIEQELSEQEGVHVVSTHLHLTGFCAQCQEKAREQNNHEE
jgi:Fe2+ or Zn2+ uptake regulation protein